MKLVYALLGLSLVLGGCSSSGVLGSLGGGSPAPANNIQVGNALAMPPDLQLRPPGTAPTPAYQAEPAEQTALNTPQVEPVVRAPTQDVYERYGISKLKPDGTPKSDAELKAELKAAILAEKRKTRPGYGTIGNMGNIFSDG